MRRKLQVIDRHVKVGAAAAGVIVMAGLAGWGGSTIALSGVGAPSPAASGSTAEARSTVSPTTQPTAATPTEAAGTTGSAAAPARGADVAPQMSSAAPPPVSSSPAMSPQATVPAPVPPSSPPHAYEPDIAFVGPSPDSMNGQWYYRIGLVGFPADTVVEISGYDTHGNVQVAPLAMTTAEGSWNPFTAGFGTMFAYGGTCGTAAPRTVTARGRGFSVTETAPRPVECDGGTTPDGPWIRPAYPTPTPAPTTSPWTSESGGV